MTVANTWPHDPGENGSRWPHVPGDRHGHAALASSVQWRRDMRRVYQTTAPALAALAFVGSACQSGTALSQIQNKQLSVSVVGTSPADLTATLNTSNSPPYPCGLEDDAFARLNGQSVPLFRGAEYTVSTVDDGEVGCHEPSVTVTTIPSGLSPPWTLEIGDSSEIVSATVGPEAYQVGPILTSSLTSSKDTLTVQISGGDLTEVADIKATLTASDGQSASRSGTIVGSTFEIANAVAPGWPPGSIAVEIDLSYFPCGQLLGCQVGDGANARCSVTCTRGDTVSMTTALVVPLACTTVNGVCT
jgi:hypothetical protein